VREQAGLTQLEFCDRLGIKSVSYVSKLENGLRSPGPEIVFLLRDHFGVERQWLINGEGAPPQGKPVPWGQVGTSADAGLDHWQRAAEIMLDQDKGRVAVTMAEGLGIPLARAWAMILQVAMR